MEWDWTSPTPTKIVVTPFSMTINKAQGQSVDHVGLDLRTDIFAHGQLYVALSRCTLSQRIKALFKNDASTVTKNIVYPEVLLSVCLFSINGT